MIFEAFYRVTVQANNRANITDYKFRFMILDILLEFIVPDEFLPCINND